MLEIKVNDTHTIVSLRAKTKDDYLTDFSNAVIGFASSIHDNSGEDMHEILKELGLLVLLLSDNDEDSPLFKHRKVN